MQHTRAQQQMIDMFGQQHINALANLSNMRQEYISTMSESVDNLYIAMSRTTGANLQQIMKLFEGVDIYDKHFLVNDQELSALESTLGQAE
jgi:hypothetical protein